MAVWPLSDSGWAEHRAYMPKLHSQDDKGDVSAKARPEPDPLVKLKVASVGT